VALAGGTAMDASRRGEVHHAGRQRDDAVFLAPVPITKDNLSVVVDAGWITQEALCQGVTERPGPLQLIRHRPAAQAGGPGPHRRNRRRNTKPSGEGRPMADVSVGRDAPRRKRSSSRRWKSTRACSA
jgi:hypothetical protein